MTRYFCLCLLGLLLLEYTFGQELLGRQERGAKRRKQKGLKSIPGCEWIHSECNPKKGRCGKGFQTVALTGQGCPSKSKRIRCRIPCREEARGPITGLSPSQAGLRGEAVRSNVAAVSKAKTRKGKNKACKYLKGTWSPCNLATNTKSRTISLKKGDPVRCEAKKIVSRRCKSGKKGKRKNKVGKAKGCKYSRGEWTECDVATNTRTRILTLRKGVPGRCQETITVTRKCKKACKYTRGNWSVCNPVTSVKSRTLTLRKGDPSVCESTKIIKRKCKKQCRYLRGQWSDCDETTLLRTRTDQLKDGDTASVCDKSRTVTKPCKVKDKHKCKYDIKPWGECDPITKERTREKILLGGGPSCEATKIIRRSCKKNNGEERCFFGPWGDFEDCLNGVKKKMRAVINGPTICERKAVKTRPCKSRKSL